MSRRKRKQLSSSIEKRRRGVRRQRNQVAFKALVGWLIPENGLFPKGVFHGNVSWTPENLARQALIWAWQETRNVTNAFAAALDVCEDLKVKRAAENYTSFINALDRYRGVFGSVLRRSFQTLAEQVAGRFWRNDSWVLFAFDGSRVTTPRTVSNEKEFCAANYGKGTTARYRKKKSKGMRRRNNEKNKPHPQGPQVWITMMWHMALRLPWSWRLGPSNSSERGHVMEMLEEEEFPENSLFCGDAGFVGYDFWKGILDSGGDFLVRVGGNVSLLSEQADVNQLEEGIVLCWPKDKMNSGKKPLRLRLVNVKIGKTSMWMLTSVLTARKLSRAMIIKYYKMRWGVEVEYRGLKQTLEKRKLRSRNSRRVYVELDWSIRAMAFAELVALREQIREPQERESGSTRAYDTKRRSLARTMHALRTCMRNLHKYVDAGQDLMIQLSKALVSQYKNTTDKRARYHPKNPDKKPLGDPTIRKLKCYERAKLKRLLTA